MHAGLGRRIKSHHPSSNKGPSRWMNTIDSQTGILCVNRVQCAFKDSMIRGILQFTLRIAFRCVLHRCVSLEIRCLQLYLIDINQWSDKKTVVCYRLKRAASLGQRFTHSQRITARKQASPRPDTINSAQRLSWLPATGTQSPAVGLSSLITNDPTAGSPTVTLLRLLVPLNDQVWPASLQKSDVAIQMPLIRRSH